MCGPLTQTKPAELMTASACLKSSGIASIVPILSVFYGPMDVRHLKFQIQEMHHPPSCEGPLLTVNLRKTNQNTPSVLRIAKAT